MQTLNKTLLLDSGYHISYVDVAGSPAVAKIGDAFCKYVTTEHPLFPAPCFDGVRRGGLHDVSADQPAIGARMLKETAAFRGER